MKFQLIKPSKRWLALGVMSLMVVFISTMTMIGCAAEEDEAVSNVKTAAEIAQTSDDDYDNNENGLITVTTLKSWIDDWATNKPSGITGNLVILSATDGAESREYIEPNGTDIFSYAVASSEWVETRSNGVTETVSMVLSGASMDLFLKKYAVDPSADMVVFVMGTGSNFGNMLIGRGWYLFRYWGTEKEHIAVLNGGLDYHTTTLADTYFSATASTAPDDGTFSVKSLVTDNTALQASLDEMFKVANGTDVPSGGAFLWDSRSADEFAGVADSTSASSSDCGDDGATRCKVAFEGTIKGAVNLEYTNLLDADAGYSYKSKADILTAVTAAGYTSGETIYTWCRTSYRAMITLISGGVVLGYPAKVYDGAWIEWGSLSSATDHNGASVLPSTSPWLTDIAAQSDNVTMNTTNLIEAPTVTDADATSADAIIVADKAYK
jgi:3-mercaptopyruvate sulfurtransferase SseA